MKLLLDQNLSFKLCRQLVDIFPDSKQVRLLAMEESDDAAIWDYAKANGFILVSQDVDFADRATLYGPPPKVIWLRCGNQPTRVIEKRLRDHADAISAFEQDDAAACWRSIEQTKAACTVVQKAAAVGRLSYLVSPPGRSGYCSAPPLSSSSSSSHGATKL